MPDLAFNDKHYDLVSIFPRTVQEELCKAIFAVENGIAETTHTIKRHPLSSLAIAFLRDPDVL